jgi:hypothetical protein
VDGDSDKDTERILEKINAGLDTSLPARYSAELGDFIKMLVSAKVSVSLPVVNGFTYRILIHYVLYDSSHTAIYKTNRRGAHERHRGTMGSNTN